MGQVSGSLITRTYSNFKGVDFFNKDVSLYRSPDSLNMWKNYRGDISKGVETRPDIELFESFENTIFGLFFYKVNDDEMLLVHSGTKLYKLSNNEKVELFSGMKPARSSFFVYNNILYIKDGLNYLRYDGVDIGEVVGFVPTTSIGRKAIGGGTVYQDVNMLSPYRKNTFLGDGTSTEYYLDAKNLDDEAPQVTIADGLETRVLTPLEDYTWDSEMGKIIFSTPPEEPLTDGQDNITVTFKKTVPGLADRIKKCTLLSVFDNRVFFSGNKDYPNALWHSSLDDPTYCSDLDYYNEGLDLAEIKSMVAGNNALWVFKEPSQANTTIFYHNPVIDSEYGKVYPSTHSSISTGCIGAGINFNDDIVFFSDRGMEAIYSDVTTEQIITHRSTLIDPKLLNEENYKKMILEEYEGYLLVIIGNKVYLADSRATFQNINHIEYEWFYWELSKNITCSCVKDNILYLGSDDGIYTLTNNDEDRELISYWTTTNDNFGYAHYQKTTNKRGCVIELDGKKVDVLIKTDNNDFELIKEYENTKGYVVSRIKKKKWKEIQMKFSSNKPFGIYSNTLEAYVGSYVKR